MSKRAVTNILVVVNIFLIAILVLILWLPGRNKKEVAEARVFFTRDIASLPYWVAQEKGYFDSVQVKVKGDEVPRIGDEIDMVGRGTMILGLGATWDALIGKATTNLPKYRVIYSVFGTPDAPQTALVARADKEITSINDLTGKRLGYFQDTRGNLTIPALLAEAGVDTAGIKMTALSTSEIPTAFIDNRCEAMVVYEPFRSLFIADTDNVVLLEDGFLEKHLVSDLPVALGFTSIANFKLRNKTTVKLIKAMNLAVDFINSNPDEAEAIALANLGLPEGTHLKLPKFSKYNEQDPQVITAYLNRLKSLSVILFEVPDLKDIYLRSSDVK